MMENNINVKITNSFVKGSGKKQLSVWFIQPLAQIHINSDGNLFIDTRCSAEYLPAADRLELCLLDFQRNLLCNTKVRFML